MARKAGSVGLSLLAAFSVGFFVLLSGTSAQAGSEKSQVSTHLDDTGSDADAEGSLKIKFSEKKSGLDLKVSGLEPETEYEVEVEGVPEASFTTKKSGKASVKFRSNANAKQEPLDFDPRGRTLSISDDGDDVLEVSLDGDSLGDDSKLEEQTNIPVTSLAPGAEIEASYRLKKGRRDFKVEAQNLAAGSYEVFVGGILRGVLVTSGAKGTGELEFRDPVGDDADKLPLDFDPTGQEITVAQGANIFATGPFLAQIPGVSVCTESDTEVALTAQAGAPVGGSAKAELKTEDRCKRSFEVELEDVPVGSYDLFVGGILQGTIAVVASVGGTHGEIEFESHGSGSDDIDELPLDFDPATATIDITAAGSATVLFSGSLGNGAPSGPSACTDPESEIRIALFNVGPDGDAKGDARYRVRDDCSVDFRVEVENLAAGEYDLFVDGANEGTIEVTSVGGELQGEIEFRNPVEPGKILLGFDPRGQLVEVRRNATTFLSRTFPTAE